MKIAVWYHCILSHGSVPIDTERACGIMAEQMNALKKSGLMDAATEFYVGVNGDLEDAKIAAMLSSIKAHFIVHGKGATSELPTIFALRKWLPAHADWLVLYHHIKGVTRPDNEEKQAHRRTMEKAVIWNWKTCVRDLERGFDAVGVNLVDPDTRPVFPNCRFFAGNFWWAKASYLMQLPPVPAKITKWSDPQRCIAEMWIGRCGSRPAMLDYERPELAQWCIASGKVKA